MAPYLSNYIVQSSSVTALHPIILMHIVTCDISPASVYVWFIPRVLLVLGPVEDSATDWV